MGKKDSPEKSKSKKVKKQLFKKASSRSLFDGRETHRYNSIPEDASETDDEFVGPPIPRRGSADSGSPTSLIPVPSPVVAPLPSLTLEEWKFFQLVEEGDLDKVKEVIASEAFQNMNINKTNRLGYTVLHIAVRKQDEDMVEYLLKQPGIRVYDTILHAIREDNKPITKMLLAVYDNAGAEEEKRKFAAQIRGSQEEIKEFVSKTAVTAAPKSTATSIHSGVKTSFRRAHRPRFGPPKKTLSYIESQNKFPPVSVNRDAESGDEDDAPFDSEFPNVITPLMLAAQTGSAELMDLFYSRGERLETPEFTHNKDCTCDICAKLEGDQDMTRAHQRYQLFKSITEPAYICFIARKEKIDPVNYAIDKLINLREICDRDTTFNALYAEFPDKLEQFITELLALCRNTTEAEIFLSPKDTKEKERLPHHYPRLWYAVGLKLQKFVAHPNTQTIVYKLWVTDDWPDWDGYPFVSKVCVFLIHACLWPVAALILLLCPCCGLKRRCGSPLGRFMTYIGSYFTFLAVLSFQVLFPYQRCNDDPPYYQVRDDVCKERGPPQIGTEWVLVVYVMSFYVSILKRQSVGWYWSMKWNWYELACQLLFTAAFLCWVWSWAWTIYTNKDLIIATDRLMWPHNCAEIFGECFLALATMFAFGRLLRFVQIFPTIGPIQVGLGKQITDFIITSCIYVVVLIAFASGLMALYVPYKDMEGYDKTDKLVKQSGVFADFFEALQNLFWYLYGHASEDPVYLVSWDLPNVTGENGEIIQRRMHHEVTEWTGVFLYLGYHVVGNLMMFNMLGGYFAQTLKAVMDDVDKTWKYARTELYLTFAKDTVLPPPLNLIPTVQAMSNGFKFFTYLGKKDDKGENIARCSCLQCCYINESSKRDKWHGLMKGYRRLIVQLLYRFNNCRYDPEGPEHDIFEVSQQLTLIKNLFKKKKPALDKDLGEPSSDDDNFPPGGGATSKWAKARRYLQGAEFRKISAGEEGGSATSQQNGAGGSPPKGGAASPGQNARSDPVVTTTPPRTFGSPHQSTHVTPPHTSPTSAFGHMSPSIFQTPPKKNTQQAKTPSPPVTTQFASPGARGVNDRNFGTPPQMRTPPQPPKQSPQSSPTNQFASPGARGANDRNFSTPPQMRTPPQPPKQSPQSPPTNQFASPGARGANDRNFGTPSQVRTPPQPPKQSPQSPPPVPPVPRLLTEDSEATESTITQLPQRL